MGAEWHEVALGELVEIFDGPHATPPKTQDGPIFLGISNLANGRLDLSNTEHLSEEHYEQWTRRVVPQPGDVVFSYETRLGEAALIPPDLYCCLGRRMGLLRARTGKVDKCFLLYAYLGPEFQETLRSRTIHGSTVDRIPLIDIASFPIRVPKHTGEQRRIARILGALDDKIELNRRMNETLESMARALFKSWFVDFDPVRAKAEGGDLRALAPDATALFPDSFDQDQMPLGWRLGQLADVASVVMGASPPGEMYNERGVGVPLVNGPVEYGNFFLEKKKWTTQQTRLSLKGDLILCVRGSTTGRHAFADDEYCLGRGVCAIRAIGPAQALVNRVVLDSLPKLLSKTTGSVFPNLSSEDIKSFGVVVPPLPIVELYCKLVAPLDQRIWNNVSESRTLSLLRDSLLPKLISGELRVEHTQQIVHEILGRADDE
jgi:type I restriction enzyme S subunit